MIQSLQYRKASFLGTEQWQSVPWEITPKDIYQKLYDKGFALAALLEKLDDEDILSPNTERPERSGYLRMLIDLDAGLSLWYQKLHTSTPSPIFWPTQTILIPSSSAGGQNQQAPAQGALPSFEYRNLRVANITVTYWALRTILSNTIAIICGAILSTHVSTRIRSINSNNLLETAQQQLTRHGSVTRHEYATNIMRSMPYCLNDNKGLLGAQKSLFSLRAAFFSLRRYPGEELKWCAAVYRQLDNEKGLRYAREIARFDRQLNPPKRDCISNSMHGTPSEDIPREGGNEERNEEAGGGRQAEFQPPDVDEAFLKVARLAEDADPPRIFS